MEEPYLCQGSERNMIHNKFILYYVYSTVYFVSSLISLVKSPVLKEQLSSAANVLQ